MKKIYLEVGKKTILENEYLYDELVNGFEFLKNINKRDNSDKCNLINETYFNLDNI